MRDDEVAWREQQRQAAAGRAAALEADRAAEARQASALLDGFVERAGSAGLEPHPLHAKTLDGRSTYRTHVRGWYLRADRSIAVGAAGEYYILTVPASLRARFAGAELSPSRPRLIVGAGGGDGQPIPLTELLDRRLEAGSRWP
jgi:hypothetical protein